MYWLTFISSMASIFSLVISFFDYFKKWRTYLFYVSCFTVGLTIGILVSMSEKTIQQFTQPQLIYLIAFVCIISMLILFIYRFLTIAHEPILVSILVIVGVSYFSIRLLNSVEGSQSFIKNNDYLILSKYYQNSGDYVRSAEFLMKYRDIQAPILKDNMLDSIDKKIDSLYNKAIPTIK